MSIWKRVLGLALLSVGLILTHLLVYSHGWEAGVSWYKRSRYMQKALESAFQLGKASSCYDRDPYFLDPPEHHHDAH